VVEKERRDKKLTITQKPKQNTLSMGF